MPTTNYYAVNGVLIGESTGGVRTDYLTDALGSVTATMDESANIKNTYRYKPYGDLLAKTGTDPDPKFMWNGSTGSRKTGLTNSGQYNINRHYGTEQAAWTSRDPLWPDELAYVYVGGNPTSRIDRYGLKIEIGEWKCWERKLDPCKKFEKPPIYNRLVKTPCGMISLPSGINHPYSGTDPDAWCCWERRLRQKKGGFGYCMSQVLKALAEYQLFENMKDGRDKLVHCMIGCYAHYAVDSCCSYFLAIHMENKWAPKGNHEYADYRATIDGMRCAEGTDLPGWLWVCRWTQLNEIPYRVFRHTCRACCEVHFNQKNLPRGYR